MITRHILCFLVSSDCYILLFVAWCACGGRGGYCLIAPDGVSIFYDFFIVFYLLSSSRRPHRLSANLTARAYIRVVELSNAGINRFSDGFFPSTSHLWNSLPSAVFPASFNLPSFKRQVYHHLRDQMA